MLFHQLSYQRLLDLNRSDQRLNLDHFRMLLGALAYEKLKQQELQNQVSPINLPCLHSEHDFMATWLANAKMIIERFPEPAAYDEVDPEKLIERGRPALRQLIEAMLAQQSVLVEHIAAQDAAADDSSPGHSTGPDNARRSGDGQPIEANNRDVVLVHPNMVTFNIRWTPTECVDREIVRFCDAKPRDLNLSKVKRIKIYGFRREPLRELLNGLSEHTEVLDLQIGTLVLLQGQKVSYCFRSLRTLSVDSIRIVDDDGIEIEEEADSLVTFNAQKLNALFLGELLN